MAYTTIHPGTYFRARSVGAEGWVYVSDGYTSVYCWDGVLSAGVLAGLAEPSGGLHVSQSATAGSFSSGTHYLRHRYINSRTGYPSEPATQTAFLALADKKIAVYGITASADPRVDQIALEMTAVGGAEYYLAAYITNMTRTGVGSAYMLSINDAILQAKALDYEETGHGRPLLGRLMAYHKGRMFQGGAAIYQAFWVHGTAGHTSAVIEGCVKTSLGYIPYMIDIRGRPSYSIEEVLSTGVASGNLRVSPAFTSTFTYGIGTARPRYPNRVYVSLPLFPESFSIGRYIDTLQNSADTLTAMVPLRSGLLFIGKHTLDMLAWEVDPTDSQDARMFNVARSRGAVNAECVTALGDTVFGMDYRGMWAFRGGAVVDISAPIADDLLAVRWQRSDLFFAVADDTNDSISFFVNLNSDGTTPYGARKAFVYFPALNQWVTHTFAAWMTAGGRMPDGYGGLRPFLGTKDGASFFAGIGYSDGVRPGYTVGGTFATGGSTTGFRIATGLDSETVKLPTAGQKLRGATAYWAEKAYVGVITSNTATSVFIAAGGFTSAPVAGQTVYLGRIPCICRTKQYSVPLDSSIRALKLCIAFTPLTKSRTLKVHLYEDGSATAKSDWASDTTVQGVTFTSGADHIEVDLATSTGVVEVPLQMSWKRTVQFQFEIDAPLSVMELMSYQIVAEVE